MTNYNVEQDKFDEAGNITNPIAMYPRFIQQEVRLQNIGKGMEASKDIIREFGSGLEGVSNLEDVSSELANSSSISGQKQDKGGRSY